MGAYFGSILSVSTGCRRTRSTAETRPTGTPTIRTSSNFGTTPFASSTAMRIAYESDQGSETPMVFRMKPAQVIAAALRRHPTA